ncbi:MAG: SMP-30/gluconolactonase/LRE family protein [Burkholderiales bacterium]|nr:SMP-30/gluconolactonase/LRE family protein [Burkholderiales bacterium]
MTPRTNEGTASLDKALDVLDAVGSTAAGLAQAELGQRLGLPRTTLYRLLGTLVARGLLRRDPLRRVYCLGSRCFEYARAAYAMPDLVAAASSELRGLRDMTGETTYLAALDGLEVISLDRCDGAHAQRSHSAVGQRKPLHCTSQGKAILAALPPERRDALVRDMTLAAVTPRSITDRRRLLAELKLTAQRGWSIDDEEIVVGVRCCGAPIVDAQGEVRGAVSVAGPAFRLTMERLELLGPELAEAARRIGAQLPSSRPARPEGEARVVPGAWAFEGAFPCWAGSAAGPGRLWWADRLAPALHAASAEGDETVAGFEHPVLAVLPDRAGTRVLAGDHWHLCGSDGQLQEDVEASPSLPRYGVLAACAGPAGQAWFCQPDGDRWRVATPNAGGPFNGGWRLNEPATALAWGEAQRTLYIAAAGSGTIYTAQEGQAGLRRLATVPKGSGRLGGLAVDAEGGLWAALRGGWSVARFEPDGSMDRMVALPVPAPTGVAFGGADGRTLFVTTAREALDRESLEAAPLSGRLFVVAAV